jgi:hypothetical protein
MAQSCCLWCCAFLTFLDGREHVYVQSFRHALTQAQHLTPELQPKEVRGVVENAFKLAQEHAQGALVAP